LFKAFIIADENEQINKLISGLAERGFTCSVASNREEVVKKITERVPDLMFVAMDGLPLSSGIWHLVEEVGQEWHLPIVALLSREALSRLDSTASLEDFVVEPWNATEVALRAKRVLQPTNHTDHEESIRCGDLVIDLAKCEVSLSSRPIPLTFKEYELLRFLATSRGRVCTRQTLLNRVWGYDYYGGDRTVDVHIRRLRSKIEDPTHTFIDTVRNIGYRFRDEA
jgi:two-component system alkaline phosphatase synthesis response regulator PhoP